uniref:Uncharacterized protein n=1 Tax=Cacopsylla melanoneura TaxID=428564 RepID=A0A8D9F3M0_9HEMI
MMSSFKKLFQTSRFIFPCVLFPSLVPLTIFKLVQSDHYLIPCVLFSSLVPLTIIKLVQADHYLILSSDQITGPFSQIRSLINSRLSKEKFSPAYKKLTC